MDTDIHSHAPETKAGIGGEHRRYDEVMRLFEAFKAENDERLAGIERRAADSAHRGEGRPHQRGLTRRLDELALKAARPALIGTSDAAAQPQDAARTQGRIRRLCAHRRERGVCARSNSRRCRSAPIRTAATLVPVEIETRDRPAAHRDLADPRHRRPCAQISGNVYKKPFMITGAAVGWVGETAARPQTDTPTLDELSFPAMELYAMPAATATLLEDARSTSTSGSPPRSSRPSRSRRAPPSSPATAPTSRRASSPTPRSPTRPGAGATSATSRPARPAPLPADDPSDVLIDLIYALKSGYRQNASFVMNRKTQSAVRKFKDADGNYLWQPPAVGERQRHA